MIATKRKVEKLKAKKFEALPTVKKVLTWIQQNKVATDMGTKATYCYQGTLLNRNSETMSSYRKECKVWLTAVDECLVQQLTTQEEEHTCCDTSATPSFGHASLEAISQWFAILLEKAGIDISAVQEEWDDMVEYSKQHLNLVQEYKNVWWKLFNCADSKNWSNVLGLIELLSLSPTFQWTPGKSVFSAKTIQE